MLKSWSCSNIKVYVEYEIFSLFVSSVGFHKFDSLSITSVTFFCNLLEVSDNIMFGKKIISNDLWETNVLSPGNFLNSVLSIKKYYWEEFFHRFSMSINLARNVKDRVKSILLKMRKNELASSKNMCSK